MDLDLACWSTGVPWCILGGKNEHAAVPGVDRMKDDEQDIWQ